MLLLRRRQSESLIITVDGREIIVKVMQFDGRRVKTVQLGIEAPDDVKILRSELVDDCA
jgi:carbon storage regulator CsrA